MSRGFISSVRVRAKTPAPTAITTSTSLLPDGGMTQSEAVESIYLALLAHTPYKKPIDIVAGYAETFDRRKTLPTLERVIEREGVLLYERK